MLPPRLTPMSSVHFAIGNVLYMNKFNCFKKAGERRQVKIQ